MFNLDKLFSRLRDISLRLNRFLNMKGYETNQPQPYRNSERQFGY